VAFHPEVTQGTLHANDALAIQAQADASTAYTTLVGQAPTTNLTGQNLGGLTLTPGVYHFNTSAQLTGQLLLNTTINPTGNFIFQIGTALTTASNSTVLFVGLADPNIFWQIGSSATLGTNTHFDGSLLALTSITLTTGASITAGRALALNGAVTLDTNSISAFGSLPTGRFWNGGASNLWSGLNWSPDITGATTSTLIPGTDVVFSVTGTQPNNQNTILDVDETISSLTVNDPTAVTISGPHTLSFTGAGVANGITINGGAGLVTINSNLLLSGLPEIITVNNTAGLAINGIVAGTIGLIKAGPGQLTLAGANIYTGGTTVVQGTLQIGNGGASGSIVGNVTNEAALVFDRSDILTFAGTITGSGSLSQSGTGKLILNAANTYNGGTNFNAGILSAASDGNLGSGHLTFNGGTLEATGSIASSKTAMLNTPGGTFLADAGTSSILSGVISGPGSLTKDGLGEVILTGMNTYSGGTILSDGVLAVGGAQALGAGNVMVNGGILRADRQPINVIGNYTQNAGGTLQLQVAGVHPGQYDSLTVAGNATLGGTLQLISLGFQPKSGNLLTLVSTGGVISGKFAQFVNPFVGPGFTFATLIYQPDAVLLEFRTAASFALTPNRRACWMQRIRMQGIERQARPISWPSSRRCLLAICQIPLTKSPPRDCLPFMKSAFRTRIFNDQIWKTGWMISITVPTGSVPI
jgi:fibronectin-binding autotransporter adhesin